MAINPYFKNQRKEQNVLEDLAIETIKIHGQNMIYMPRTLTNEDALFGEDTQSVFNNGYEMEMYISNVDGFEGEGDIISKFGLQINDTATFVASKKRFRQAVGDFESGITGPREGDMIYMPLTKGLFQITFVEIENPFHQLGKLYTYDLTVELIKYSKEQFKTGWPDIDNLGAARDNPMIQLALGGHTGEFLVGEIITDAAGVTAEVITWNTSANLMEVAGRTAAAGMSGLITGSNSNALGTIGSASSLGITTDALNDPFGSNSAIELEGQDYINFSDKDPFSEGNF